MTEWQRTKSPIHMYGTRRTGDASGPEILELSLIYRPSMGEAVARQARAVQPKRPPKLGFSPLGIAQEACRLRCVPVRTGAKVARKPTTAGFDAFGHRRGRIHRLECGRGPQRGRAERHRGR